MPGYFWASRCCSVLYSSIIAGFTGRSISLAIKAASYLDWISIILMFGMDDLLVEVDAVIVERGHCFGQKIKINFVTGRGDHGVELLR